MRTGCKHTENKGKWDEREAEEQELGEYQIQKAGGGRKKKRGLKKHKEWAYEIRETTMRERNRKTIINDANKDGFSTRGMARRTNNWTKNHQLTK